MIKTKVIPFNWLLLVFGVILLAVFFNRPVKVSVSDNIFIEMGIEEVNVGVVKEPMLEGPPESYRATIELSEGKTVYVLMDGSCRVEE